MWCLLPPTLAALSYDTARDLQYKDWELEMTKKRKKYIMNHIQIHASVKVFVLYTCGVSRHVRDGFISEKIKKK